MDNIKYRTELITDLAALKNHREKYKKFCAFLPTPEQFTYNLDWVIEHHPLYTLNNTSLFWIFFWDKEEIVGVAPLQKEYLSASRLGLRRLRIWGDNNYYSHNTQPSILIKDTSSTKKILTELMAYLHTDLKYHWDEIFFHRIKKENSTFKIFIQLFPYANEESSTDITYYFSAPNNIEDIIKGESKRKIKKGLEKLKLDFTDVSINCFRHVSPEKYSQIVDLHTKRQFSANQKGADRNSFFDNAIEKKTIHNEIKYASQQNGVRLYTLEVEGVVAAFLLCYHLDDWTYAHITAFDDEYKNYKVARVLWFHAFTEERKTYGCNLIDTGWGGNSFKQAFSNKTKQLYAIRTYNKKTLRSKFVTQTLDVVRKLKNIYFKS